MSASALISAGAAGSTEPAMVGGKGGQLGRLADFGLPVPDFFVIPADWSRQRAAGLPAELAAQLVDELGRRGWLNTPLAVRSSAVGEDSAKASFAGIHLSCLNVTGASALGAAVTAVWDSLDTAAAQAYRQRLGIAGEALMAVVVMPLLPAQAAGIAFTCDPLSGREDQLLVQAAWGLGEALVGGETEGDEYRFAEDATDTWRLETQRIGRKLIRRVIDPAGGTRSEAVPSAEAGRAVLNTEQAEALAALVRDAAVALDFVAPFFDLEWVWDGTQFWLTQARPVTRRPHYTYPGLHGQPAIWTRGNTCEIMPEPLSPMDWNFSRRGVNHLLEQGWQIAGLAMLPGVQRAALFDGRLYLEASIMQHEAWSAIGLPPTRFNSMMGGHQPCIATTSPTWRARLWHVACTLRYLTGAPALRRQGEEEVARCRALARQALQAPLPEDNEALRQMLYGVARPAREARGLFFLQGSGGGSLAMLLETLARHFPGESDAIAAALLAGGEPSVTAQQGYDLLALAHQSRELGDGWREHPDFCAAFAEFLDKYGHRGHYETYLRNPRWHETPAALLDQLPDLAKVDGAALRERQRRASQAAWQRLRRALPWWRYRWLRTLARAANRECNQREAARSALIALLAGCRRLWLVAGERMRAMAMLDTPDEVFWLMPYEADRAVAGQIPAAGLRARIAVRRRLFAAWQATAVADFRLLSADGSLHGVAPAVSRARPVGDVWTGVATGTGVVCGRVRRLCHPGEGGMLLPGEILVAASTDPGWTPLFLKAGGLVVETGGTLSHGAIVAREFGLPAVVNLPGIMAELADGDEVEVDGASGQVRRLSAAAQAAPRS